MAAVQEAVRRLTIVASDRGLGETAQKMQRLGRAQQDVTVASQRQERATLSMEKRLESIKRQYDRNYRTQQTLAKVERDLTAAQAQGLITAGRKNELLKLASNRLNTTTAAANTTTTALRGMYSVFLSLGALRLGREMVRDFIGFDESLTRIVTLVGVGRDQVDAWREELIAMAPAVAKGPGELADALFFITSAGLRGETALSALAAAAKASALGLGETKIVADALTSAMNAYGAANLSAEKATAILVAAVREGKAEASDLAPVLGSLLPVASELHVGFDQVAASLAAMTRLGANAAEASTSLQAILVTLAKGGSREAETELRRLGLTFVDLRRSVREDGLLDTLLLLKDRIGDNEEALAKIFPNVRALRGLLNLLGANVEQARAVFASLATTIGEDLDAAVNENAESISFKYRQSLAELDTQMARFGEQTVPTVVEGLRLITDNLEAAAIAGGTLLGAWIGLRAGLLGAAVGATAGFATTAAMIGAARSQMEGAVRGSDLSAARAAWQATPVLPQGGFTVPAAATGAPPTPPGLSDEEIAAAQRAQEQIDKTVAALEHQAAQLDRTGRQQAQFNALQQAGIGLEHEMAGAVMGAAAALYDKTEAIALQAERLREAQRGAQIFGEAMFGALEGIVIRGENAGEVIADLIRQLLLAEAKAQFLNLLSPGSAAPGPLSLIGAFLGFGGFAKGAPFERGRVTAFAGGGIVDRPTLFPMAQGMGLMGEAGPEAVMPLRRGRDGKLGVAASGGTTVHLTVNNDFRGVDPASVARIETKLEQVVPAAARAAAKAVRTGVANDPGYFRNN